MGFIKYSDGNIGTVVTPSKDISDEETAKILEKARKLVTEGKKIEEKDIDTN